MPKQTLRLGFPTWQAFMRDVVTIFNVHTHDPYSKAGTVTTSTTLDDDKHTVSVSTSGLTITLPAASTGRMGQDWTVHLGVAGTVTIACAGSDTVCTSSSATDTSVQITTLGDSLTFRCLTATSWIIV